MIAQHHTFTVSEAERVRLEKIDRLLAHGTAALGALVAELADPSWTVRRAVVGALAALGDEALPTLLHTLTNDRRDETVQAAVVEALVASTGDAETALEPLAAHDNPAIVADVAHVLGRRQRPGAAATLIRLTEHANDNVAVAAIEGLGRVGGRPAVDALLAAVTSSNFFRIFPAIDVLGRSGDPRAVLPLAALLENRHYALEAARALGRTGDRNAVAPLARRLIETTMADVRVAASALAKLQEEYAARYGVDAPIEETLRHTVDPRAVTRRLGQAMEDADPAEKAAICLVLGVLGDEAAVPLLIPLLDDAGTVGQAARAGLQKLGRKSDALLVDALRVADSQGRAALLPLVSSASAREEAADCLEDPDPAVRAAACAALARMGVAAASEKLFARLEDANPLVVQSAISAIQSLGGPDTESRAREAARSSNARVRRWALRILAYFGHTRGLDAMLAAVDDPDPHVRESALAGLPFMEGPRARDTLLLAVRNEAAVTRAAAVRALGNCTTDARVEGAVIGAMEDDDPWVRYYACQSAGRLRIDAALGGLARLLSDPAGQVRVSAIEGLSHFDDPSARRSLVDAARSGEDDLRRAAIIGLGIARPAEALPTLAEAVRSSDPAVRLVAVSALGGFDDPDVNELLGQAAEDPEESVRNGAVGALAGRQGREPTRVLIELLRRGAGTPLVHQALSVPSPERVGGMMAALETADDDLAALLTSALARMNDDAASAALMRVMGMANAAARKAAAATLGALGTKEAMSALHLAAAEDPNPEVRRICAVLLA